MIWAKEVHLLKAEFPISVTEDGIVISVRDEHLLKAKKPIWVVKEGIEICFNKEHSLKAKFPIAVTEGGIVISDSDEHSLKAEYPIFPERFKTTGGLRKLSELKPGQIEYYFLWLEYLFLTDKALNILGI